MSDYIYSSEYLFQKFPKLIWKKEIESEETLPKKLHFTLNRRLRWEVDLIFNHLYKKTSPCILAIVRCHNSYEGPFECEAIPSISIKHKGVCVRSIELLWGKLTNQNNKAVCVALRRQPQQFPFHVKFRIDIKRAKVTVVDPFKINPYLIDVVFNIEGKRVPSNRTMLAMHSPVFRKMFSENPQNEIVLENVKLDHFMYLHNMIIPLNVPIVLGEVGEILGLARQFEMKMLMKKCLEEVDLIFNHSYKKVIPCVLVIVRCYNPFGTAFECQAQPHLVCTGEFQGQLFSCTKSVSANFCHDKLLYHGLLIRVFQWAPGKSSFPGDLETSRIFNKKIPPEKENFSMELNFGIDIKSAKVTVADPFKINPYLIDVVFNIEGKRVPSNRTMLAMHSPVFRKMFSENPQNEIVLENVKLDHFMYLHNMIIPLNVPIIPSEVEGLLTLAEKFQMDQVRKKCINFIINLIKSDQLTLFEKLRISNLHRRNEPRRAGRVSICVWLRLITF
ncbi:unnamed protein product [Caenorhabditis bovis]|uniref:BTB domain-containing protein n=1 Tax=Caenorhabditis bovis TaxID=2654633 RepID=A0A8S1F242_9PELO|nr:unnamed protein product [Caenorhabditis bovis]